MEAQPSTAIHTIVLPALRVGAYSGAAGIVFGGAAGIVRGTSPGIFAIASGAQWFALGSTFWATRSAILHSWDTGNVSRSDRTYASTVAGGFTGASAGGVLRGPSHVLPGLIMFSIFGYVGQSIYNTMDKRDDPRGAAQRVGFWQRIGNSRFSPMKVLSDEEYKRMLQEKMLRIDAEIAIIDENIDSLRQRQGEITENAPASGCE